MLHEMHSKVLSFYYLLKEYPSFIAFRFEHVHKIIFICGNMPYNLFISCRFNVELIFKGAKFHKRNQYLQS